MFRLGLFGLTLSSVYFGISLSIASNIQIQSADINVMTNQPANQSIGVISASDPANSGCSDCHKDLAKVPPPGKHADLSCATCHQPHDGKLHDDMQLGLKACTTNCHGKHDLGLSHPMGEELRDASGITLTCVTICHSIHVPSYEPLLRAEGSDVCGSCHAEKF